MRLGDEIIELTEYLAPKGRPIPVDSRSNDRWFQHIAIVVSDMDRAYQRLRANKVQHASTGPQRSPDWNKSAGWHQGFLFQGSGRPQSRDSSTFPPARAIRSGSGQRTLFFGIDHTAIVVSDTQTQLKILSRILGLKLAGESENYGTEQEHLNNVFGARVRISGLEAQRGARNRIPRILDPA